VTEKTIGIGEARRQLGPILKSVARQGDHYVVGDHGEPIAALVPIAFYVRWKRDRDRLLGRVEAAERAGLTPSEADALANEAVQAVRRDHVGYTSSRLLPSSPTSTRRPMASTGCEAVFTGRRLAGALVSRPRR